MSSFAALLGRFLPRLGPLPQPRERLTFFLLSGDAGRSEDIWQAGQQRAHDFFQIGAQANEAAMGLKDVFIHIERAVDFNLHGVPTGRSLAVGLGDVASGIGLIAGNAVACAAKC